MHPSRKPERMLNEEQIKAILDSADYGVLSVNTEEGYPYAVPVNYVYDDHKIYIHGANKGLKYESCEKNGKACFTIVTNHLVLPAQYSTAYQSVIAFGKVHIASEDEKAALLAKFVQKYAGLHKDQGTIRIEAGFKDVSIIIFEFEQVTGKERPVVKKKCYERI